MKWIRSSLVVIGICILVIFIFCMKSVAENIDNPDWIVDGIKAILFGGVGILLIIIWFLTGKKKKK